jgi:hypothetical protein
LDRPNGQILQKTKTPKFFSGRVDWDPHCLMLIDSMAWTERRMSSRASSLLQNSMVSRVSKGKHVVIWSLDSIAPQVLQGNAILQIFRLGRIPHFCNRLLLSSWLHIYKLVLEIVPGLISFGNSQLLYHLGMRKCSNKHS